MSEPSPHVVSYWDFMAGESLDSQLSYICHINTTWLKPQNKGKWTNSPQTEFILQFESKALVVRSFFTSSITAVLYLNLTSDLWFNIPTLLEAEFVLTKYKVVRSEDLSKRSRADWIHGAWFQIHKDGSGHILPTCTHRGGETNLFKLKCILHACYFLTTHRLNDLSGK